MKAEECGSGGSGGRRSGTYLSTLVEQSLEKPVSQHPPLVPK